MRKLKTILLTLSLLIVGGGNAAMAQTQHNATFYEAAKAAVEAGTYRISTEVSGTKYYVTTAGKLTSDIASAGFFDITQTSGGNYGTGFRISSASGRFTNPPLQDDVANLKPGNFATSTNDRVDWERQILYLNGDGKYAIRSCNCADGTSSWNDAARTHWTYFMVEDVPTPCYSYTAEYIWDFEGPLTTVNVTYKLVEADGTTQVSSTTVKQEANSAIANPLPVTGITYKGFFHEKFYYDYTTEGTIGSNDCTITITRTEKAGVVKALTDLSNNKAYNIGCDRGAMIAYDGKMVNTALNNAAANAKPYGKFALLNYEGNYYIFSIDENKFVKNDASVALDLTAAGFSTEDAMVMTPQTAPYFLWHFNATDKYLNTNGNTPLGYVINDYSTPDPGNLYYMVAVDDFDPTAALAELDAYFHPAYFVTYVVKDEAGNTIFTSEKQPAKGGATITALPADFQRPYYTYNNVDVTISDLETTVEFTATWNGPFKISADFANAQWQNMAMRGTWSVTTDNLADDGAYKSVNANAVGLVKDAYQWAFVGNGYDGFKIINKAEGDGKSFGWTDATATNAGIPTIMADGEGHHVWKIVASTNTSVPTGSFCLNVPGTNLYINQYGGEGGSLKFWNSGNNVGDAGSAFTVFDVPTNFAEFTANIEAQLTSDITGYFTYNEATRALWKDEYKTNCPYDTYVALQEAIDNPDNLKWPATGFYRIKSKYYDGRYISYAEHENNPYMATLVNPTESISNIVKLTAKGNNKYTITVGGLNATAPAQSRKIGLEKTGAELQAVVLAPGVCTFTSGEQYGALHCASSSDPAYFCVGWSTNADASQWIIEDATIDPKIDVTITDAGYATLNALWPVTIPEGVKAYTAKVNGVAIDLTEVTGTIPAATPVILEGAAGTYTFTITDDVAAAGDNDLIGTYTQIAAPNESYVLQNQDKVGFYQVDTSVATPNVPANRAYLPASVGGSVKAFFFGDADAIEAIGNGQGTMDNAAIYNVAGQRISNLRRGINIVGGKKVVVK